MPPNATKASSDGESALRASEQVPLNPADATARERKRFEVAKKRQLLNVFDALGDDEAAAFLSDGHDSGEDAARASE